MAALEAATQCDRVCGRKYAFSRADARSLGGRLKAGHDEFWLQSERDEPRICGTSLTIDY